MKSAKYGNLTIEIPDELDSYNCDYPLKIKNNGNEDVEIKLELKPSSAEDIKQSWYKIEPEKLKVQGQQEAGVILRITDTPKVSKSTDEELEVVKLIVSGNPGQSEKLLWSYNLIIPPIAPETAAISLKMMKKSLISTLGILRIVKGRLILWVKSCQILGGYMIFMGMSGIGVSMVGRKDITTYRLTEAVHG